VLRVPPPRARPVGPADVLRQGRIMAALGAAGLPVPAVLAMVAGERTSSGRPFILTELVAGDPVEVVAGSAPPGALLSAAVEVLSQIGRLPVAATGIEGEPSSPPVRQVDRWEPLMRRGPPELTVGADDLADRLRTAAPPPRRVGLVHGDYQFGNLLFRGGRVAAVLDWEIAELGRPDADLGCLAVAAIRRRFPRDPNPSGGVAFEVEDVFRAAGPGHPDLEWFVAAGCYKYAAILAYNLDLHRRGRRVDPVYERLTDTVSGLIAEGRRLVEAS
jgi:aminoglycoside phosphotransferase (APT) family kinase protein